MAAGTGATSTRMSSRGCGVTPLKATGRVKTDNCCCNCASCACSREVGNVGSAVVEALLTTLLAVIPPGLPPRSKVATMGCDMLRDMPRASPRSDSLPSDSPGASRAGKEGTWMGGVAWG